MFLSSTLDISKRCLKLKPDFLLSFSLGAILTNYQNDDN